MEETGAIVSIILLQRNKYYVSFLKRRAGLPFRRLDARCEGACRPSTVNRKFWPKSKSGLAGFAC
jgi:hypothetical protein